MGSVSREDIDTMRLLIFWHSAEAEVSTQQQPQKKKSKKHLHAHLLGGGNFFSLNLVGNY